MIVLYINVHIIIIIIKCICQMVSKIPNPSSSLSRVHERDRQTTDRATDDRPCYWEICNCLCCKSDSA